MGKAPDVAGGYAEAFSYVIRFFPALQPRDDLRLERFSLAKIGDDNLHSAEFRAESVHALRPEEIQKVSDWLARNEEGAPPA